MAFGIHWDEFRLDLTTALGEFIGTVRVFLSSSCFSGPVLIDSCSSSSYSSVLEASNLQYMLPTHRRKAPMLSLYVFVLQSLDHRLV